MIDCDYAYYYTVVQKNAPTLADYNYEPVQSILIIFSKLFLNDHKSCLVVKFFTSPHIMLPLYLVKHNALFCTNYTAYRKKYVFSSGGSEKNRLITGADVRTGDLLPSRMRVAVLSTGQRLRRRRTAGCWPMCQRGASSSRLCHGPASCTDAAASGPKCGNRLLQ